MRMGLILVVLLPTVAVAKVPGVLSRQDHGRNYTCERMTLDVAESRYPGRFQAHTARGDYAVRTPMVCSERLLEFGLRAPRDEAILTTLDERTATVAAAAWSARPDLHDATWLVEVFYPNSAVSSKVQLATQTALMAQGASVSDRAVGLSATDVDVLTRLPVELAYPAACRRYAETRALSAGTVLLALVSLDPVDTSLSAGVCDEGRWTWLR